MFNNKPLIGTGLIALGLFLFWPLSYAEYKKISVMQGAIAERDAAIVERREIEQNIKKLKQEYDQRGPEMKTFSAIVPAQKSNAEMLSGIETIASQTGNLISEIIFAVPDEKTPNYTYLITTIKGTGSYGALKAMMDAFEKNIPLIDARTIEMRYDPQTNQLNYEIQALTYYLNGTRATK